MAEVFQFTSLNLWRVQTQTPVSVTEISRSLVHVSWTVCQLNCVSQTLNWKNFDGYCENVFVCVRYRRLVTIVFGRPIYILLLLLLLHNILTKEADKNSNHARFDWSCVGPDSVPRCKLSWRLRGWADARQDDHRLRKKVVLGDEQQERWQ